MGWPNGECRVVSYRPEIDGLRALAVFAIILYHTGAPAFGGGYLGVDIFFVISGYLITGILTCELLENRFSICNFYERRIRRIIPALLVLIVVVTPAAFLLMLPDDLASYGQSVVATLLFANNILLLLTSGYFELEVIFKPLMHTWSLAVEEQYYVVVPLLLGAAFKLGGVRYLLWFLSGVVLISLGFSILASNIWPVANFLLISSRAWELGVGSIAMLVQSRLRHFCNPTSFP